MKDYTIGIFSSRKDAERAINHLHNDLKIPNEEMSYIYKNTDGDIKEIEPKKVSSDTPSEGAGKGANIGAIVGALGGIAALAGVLPVIGPVLFAGPLLTAIGVGGVIGTTAVGAAGGAAIGGLIGALVNIGVGKEEAQVYEGMVMGGNILVAVHSSKPIEVQDVMTKANAMEIETYSLTV